MEKLKNRKDIIFIYINVDDDESRWKDFLIKEKMKGINLYANVDESADLRKRHKFDGIPNYVLIDKNGLMQVPMPSMLRVPKHQFWMRQNRENNWAADNFITA